MKANWLAKLDKTTTVLTANRRLSAYWLQQYETFQQQLGNQVWQTPDILPLQSWLIRNWKLLADTRQLLSDEQARLVWENIISNSSYNNLLAPVTHIAHSAKQAWELLQQYHVTATQLQTFATEDTHAFITWAEEYQAICAKENWLDESTLPMIIADAIINKNLLSPKRLIFHGFEQLNPQLEAVIKKLKEQVEIEFHDNHAKVVSKSILALTDQEQEIIMMARWAKQCLHNKPATMVGCIVPNLAAMRQQVQRIFTEVFTPEHSVSMKYEQELFNISLGLPLTDYPLVRDALESLRLLWEDISIHQLKQLLSSPYFGGAESEMALRAYLGTEVGKHAETQISLRELLAVARQHTPILAQILIKFQETAKNLSILHNLSNWSKVFSNILNILGWPGERTLNSEEYQVRGRWQNLLIQLANLDVISSEAISAKQAWQKLYHLAHSTIFQPKTDPAPVQILGVLEANGIIFDNVWVMGLSDNAWPPAATANPLLPIKLQKQFGMPYASANLKIKYFQKITNTLLSSARHIVCSYALQEDEQINRPSPLLRGLKAINLTDLHLAAYHSFSERLCQQNALETLHDEQAPPVQEAEKIKGGTDIFKQQAACPFRAFAKYRLRAENIISKKLGLDAAERGNILHEALARLWESLQTQARLLQMAPEEVERILDEAVTEAIQQHIPKRPLTLKKNFIEIEVRRLKTLLTNWIELEKNRNNFNVIHKEYSVTSEVGGIPVNMRIDRIDQLEDGSHLIIDYKSTSASLSSAAWQGDRPDEPQLLLYCVTSLARVHGLLFAQVSMQKMGYQGVTHSTCIPNVGTLANSEFHPDWDEQVIQWRTVLNNLGEAFRRGDAAVNPKQPTKTCQHCEFKILCRISEDNLMKAESDE